MEKPKVETGDLPDFRSYHSDWASDLIALRQNRLLDVSGFTSFCRDRGVPLWRTVTADVAELHQRKWLYDDGVEDDGEGLWFHPFRMYPVHRVLEAWRLKMSTSVPPEQDATVRLLNCAWEWMPTVEKMDSESRVWNAVSDLAILSSLRSVCSTP